MSVPSEGDRETNGMRYYFVTSAVDSLAIERVLPVDVQLLHTYHFTAARCIGKEGITEYLSLFL